MIKKCNEPFAPFRSKSNPQSHMANKFYTKNDLWSWKISLPIHSHLPIRVFIFCD